MVIVLLHCSTFIAVLNVALSSSKGLSFPLSQTTDIYVEKRRESHTYIYQGFHSNHAQTARFNIPTLLHRCNNHVFVVHVWALQEPLAH